MEGFDLLNLFATQKLLFGIVAAVLLVAILAIYGKDSSSKHYFRSNNRENSSFNSLIELSYSFRFNSPEIAFFIWKEGYHTVGWNV